MDWEEKITFMRANGIVEACFSTEGHLISAKLGPLAVADDTEDTQQSLTPAQLSREERRRVALGSSGGPVRRSVEK